jgi:hypothetical protein
MMVRSASAEPVKPSKRKGTRSVSTLTPSQLARKRANDREAQRAIRARTKEHIERLERELEELKSNQSRDKTVQELLRRNKALEEELFRIKETMGVSMTPSPYQSAVYDDNLSTASGPVHSPRSSPFPQTDYSPIADYSSQSYVPMPGNCEPWSSQVVSSTVSSPTSSAANPDEYNAAYIPTSVPSSLLASNNNSSSSIALSSSKSVKSEFDDVSSNDGFPVTSGPMQPTIPSSYMPQTQGPPPSAAHHHHHQHQQPWSMYPVYYPQLQSPVH